MKTRTGVHRALIKVGAADVVDFLSTPPWCLVLSKCWRKGRLVTAVEAAAWPEDLSPAEGIALDDVWSDVWSPSDTSRLQVALERRGWRASRADIEAAVEVVASRRCR